LVRGPTAVNHAHSETADHIDRSDDESGDGIATHELAGTVHCAEEVGFLRDAGAPTPRLVFINHPGIQVRIDCHLLAGHGIERESRGDFCDARRTLGDDDELHDDEDEKQDYADEQ